MTGSKVFGWHVRRDGTRCPDREAENAVLQHNDRAGFPYSDKSLGDLIVEALTHGLYTGDEESGVDWPTFEGTVLETLALELKVLAIALSGESADSEAFELFELDEVELVRLLHALARRAKAAHELAIRLREARWGHPSFGGESPEYLTPKPRPCIRPPASGVKTTERSAGTAPESRPRTGAAPEVVHGEKPSGGRRIVPRDVTARRIARLLSEIPEFTLEDDGDLTALFRLVTGFEPAERWLAKLREEVQAHLTEVAS